MTRCIDGSKVSLTLSNWAGIIVSILLAGGGQWLLLNSRVTTLEVNQINIRRDLESQEQRSATSRGEILSEIRGLRRDWKSQ